MQLGRHLRALLCGVALVAAVLAPSPVAAGEEPDTSTTLAVRDQDSPLNDILPEPGSGEAPEDPGEPGGWQQYLVFALIVGGLGAIVVLVRRESRKATATRDG